MATFQWDEGKPLNGARARIRMYRVGLGDCFLLSVNQGGTLRHMLIDCGMFGGSRIDPGQSEKALQQEIVDHIRQETGQKLDVLVVTHEHMDHVSIFNSARAGFQKMSVGEAWFGWVESDTQAARDLRAKYEKLEAHLTAGLTGLTQLASFEKAPLEPLHDGVASVAEFLGFNRDGTRDMVEVDTGAPVPAGALGAAKPVKPQPRAAIDFVKSKATKHKYGSPGDVWEFAGMKVYVLGPPPAEQQLKIMERAGATYDTALGMLGAAAGSADDGMTFPFSRQWRQPVYPGTGESLVFGDAVVDDNLKFILQRYLDPQDAWRRIDRQSLDSVPSLALQMDRFINNTSLALAFEFPGDGKDVLLFAGDAQVGNWDWWFQIDEFAVADLLKRTIFYKVGHHGSHNATLKKALELMTHPDLVAMMPTNESFARNSKHWKMPAPNLRTKLLEHARKRVLRNDQGLPNVEDDPMRDGDWGELREHVVEDPLFIDYYV